VGVAELVPLRFLSADLAEPLAVGALPLSALAAADAWLVVPDGPETVRRAATDPGCLLVNRNAGSGTRILLDGLLGGARPAGYANQPKSHNAVAAAVAQGRADWGVAIEPIARAYGLGFLPLADEHYDLFIPEARAERAAVRAFLAALAGEEARGRLAALGFAPAAPAP
jgi:putative molybdopterin biosynthesis protein